jgi:hypothetical protein
MVSKDDPSTSQMSQGANLMAKSTPSYNLNDHNFTFGYKAFYQTFRLKENGNYTVKELPFDFDSLVDVNFYQLDYLDRNSGMESKQIPRSDCFASPEDEDYDEFLDGATCIDSSKATLYGKALLFRGS